MNAYCFIFGFGYTAQALAPQLIAQGFKVVGTTRNPEKYARSILGSKLIEFDATEVETYLNLATHLLICIPPAHPYSDMVLMKYGDLIKRRAPYFNWVGYLSSTGVYGDHKGQWVNEKSDCIPHTPTGIARLKTEQAWMLLAQKYQLPLHVFRLAGIYGPGRNVLERLMQGKNQSIFKKDQVFCRIHVEDIVRTLLSSMQFPHPLTIYNVADDEPAPVHVVDQYAAHLLDLKPPQLIDFSEAHLSPMEQEFYANNRRVANQTMKKELKVVLQYPTYREGLTQIWKDLCSSAKTPSN